MTLDEARAFIRTRCIYPVVEVPGHAASEDIVFVAARAPDDILTLSSIIVSGLPGTEDEQRATLAERVDQAQAGLERYLASFGKPDLAEWDKLQWGP